MIRIRGGSGLGDALYTRAVVESFTRVGRRVTVCSDYPGVFSGLDVHVEPFNRNRIDVLAHYVAGKSRPDTTQWDDVRASASTPGIPLSISWARRGDAMKGLRERAAGRPVVLVHGGRAPMARTDGFGADLLPEQSAFRTALGELRGCFLVGIGNAKPIYRLPVEMDLNGNTSVADLIDLGLECDAVVGQCSFVVPLAEVFDKPLLAIWSARGLSSRVAYISAITPAKILSKPSSRYVMDNAPEEDIRAAARAFAAVIVREPACAS